MDYRDSIDRHFVCCIDKAFWYVPVRSKILFRFMRNEVTTQCCLISCGVSKSVVVEPELYSSMFNTVDM
jgi:hypothetical protein